MEMLETFLATLSPMLVLFLCIVIGYILRAKKILPENADKTISRLLNYVFTPALSLSTFMTNCTVDTLIENGNNILYATLCVVIGICIATPLSKLFSRNDPYKRCIYKYSLVFANFGFMGNAIVPAVLSVTDSQILYKYMLFTLPLSFVAYTWGVANLIPKGEKGESLIKRLLNPIIVALVIGAVVGLTGVSKYIPNFVIQTIDYCKVCMAPGGMILTGFVIAGFPFKSMLKDKKIYIATFLRLIVLPALLVGILYLIKTPITVMTMALFAFAMPLGLNTVIFPAAYGNDTKIGASMAMISHTLSVITIPIMFALFTLIIK